MMKEVWKFYKEIKHTNQSFNKGDILTVSDLGRVKCNGEFYKCGIDINSGYYYLCGIPLHRIIAEKFLTDWDPNKEVDHRNTIRTDNRSENLCMVTRLQNQNNPLTIQHIKESKNNPLTIQHHIEGSHKKSVLQYTLDNKFIAEYASTHEAEMTTKIYHGNIVYCCNQKRKSAGGYIWKYKNI